MTVREAVTPPADAGQARWAYGVVVGFVVLATALAVLAGGGPALAVAPVALGAAFYGIVKLPLRASAAALLVLLLAVDDSNETTGQWRTPLAILGNLVHNRLDVATGVPGISVTGMEVLCVVLLIVWAHRRGTTSIDDANRLRAPSVMGTLVIVYVVAVAFAMAHGVLHRQPLAPWKVRNLLHPILLYVVFDKAFRGPADHALLGKVVVFAAVARAVLAFVVQRLSIAQTGGKFAYATSHGDSVLFAVATFLVLADLLERANQRRLLRAAVLLPILLVGMLENGRRLVWVMLLLMLGVTFLIAPMRGWKRTITRGSLVILPVVALYVAIGWERDTRLFGPVQTLRSVVDTSYDHSAYWREVENWNIAMSMRERPLLGLGLGGRYTEHMFNDDISGDYPEYREWPHNTVLGQLLLLGLFAFWGVWALYAAALFLAVRSYRVSTTKDLRVAALACIGAIVSCHMLAYGDTGAHYDQYKVIMALALVVAGKLAVATGAWPERRAAAT